MVGASHLSVSQGRVFFRFDQILTLFELLSRPDQHPLQAFTLHRAYFSNRARLWPVIFGVFVLIVFVVSP
jgi:hypothetical protein